MLVHGYALVRERNHSREFKTVSLVEKMPILKAIGVHHKLQRFGIAFEVETRYERDLSLDGGPSFIG
jgi:hypothetical protein